MQDSQSDDSADSFQIDSLEFRRLCQKQKLKQQLRQRVDRSSEDQDRATTRALNRSVQDNSNSHSRNNFRRLTSQPPAQQRERSRQKEQTQNIRWHIYEAVQSIDYIDTLDEKLRKLPIFKKKDQILEKIIKNQVILVTGDTGCGKSTQVPRLIFQYLKAIGSNDKIICVQPRRLAVTSLKSAVQNQIQERCVGYQIGQKAEFNSNSKIVFMTNGIFLQRIIHDTSFLNEYPFVILDEVHERDIDTDFILTALKRVIRQYPKVRIVLMSATIDNKLFKYYFASDHIDSFMGRQNFYKKIIQLQEFKRLQQNSDDEGFMDQDSDEEEKKKRQIYDKVAFQFLNSKFPCPTININQPSSFKRTYYYLDTVDEFIKRDYVKKWGSIIWSHKQSYTNKQLFEMTWVILDQIRHNTINKEDKSGEAVLIFLPGLNEIQNLSEQIFKFCGGRQRTLQYFQIIHVHSTIMNDRVEEKINTPNRRQIKIIIATNIAESSITVKGVKYIIDFCLTKEIRYDMKSRMQNLQLVWSSKASCKQRAGRTGRVCDGYIFRLVENKFYEQIFEDYSQPEIKRSSLDKLILRIKLMHEKDDRNLFKDPPQVLGTCIQPPKLQSIQTAINSLKFCGGLQQRGDQFYITDLGRLYVQIPIDIAYTKLLITSILFGTFYDILILVSILSQNKNPIHRRDIQNNQLKYFDQISNYEYCDFMALVNLFISQDDFRNEIRNIKQEDRTSYDNHNSKHVYRDQQTKSNRLPFSIYSQTKNTMDDILRRLDRKKLFNFNQLSSYLEIRDGKQIRGYSQKTKQLKNQRPKYQDYFMRFKLTIAFGFVDKLILIKPPLYQTRQEKRIKQMSKANISNDKTIVLVNSSVITKPYNNNKEAEQKFIKHWKQVFKKSLDIDIRHITLTSGLNYLHFQDQKGLNKLLYIKYMESNSAKRKIAGCSLQTNESSKRNSSNYTSEQNNKNERGSSSGASSSSLLTTKQILQCLGDIDHMQQGIPVTLLKHNRTSIDSYSLNRVSQYNEKAGQKYLVTNSFMLQNKNSLTCRYTSALKIFSYDQNKIPNTILHVLINLLFYPFVKLKANKKNTMYENLALKKNYLIKIPYSLTSKQIQEANIIRQLLKQFLELKRKMNPQVCGQFYDLIKKFICKKRKDFVHDKVQQVWQNQFLREVKEGKIPQIQQLYKLKSEIQTKKNQYNKEEPIIEDNKYKQNEDQNKVNLDQKISNVDQTKLKTDQNKLNIDQIRNHLRHANPGYENRNFMNSIELPLISVQESYFLKNHHQSPEIYKKRMELYLGWKLAKLNEIQKLTTYAEDNDTYLCCGFEGGNCLVPLCKLKRIGSIQNGMFRDLFEPLAKNLKQSQQECSHIDNELNAYNFQEEYAKVCCKNNHQIGIQMKGQTRVKIIIFSQEQYVIKYPNDLDKESIKYADFQDLEMSNWAKQQKAALHEKERRLLSTSCYLCAQPISTLKQLRTHFRDTHHMKNLQNFNKSIQKTRFELDRGNTEQQQQIQMEESFQNQNYKKQALLPLSQKLSNNNEMEIQY